MMAYVLNIIKGIKVTTPSLLGKIAALVLHLDGWIYEDQ